MDLYDWLLKTGLERCHSTLVSNGIDIDVLADLTDADLEKIGLPLGDRRRLLRVVRDTLIGTTPLPAIDDANVSRGVSRATAERRNLTVMICDLVGSTTLSSGLDPEDMRAVMDAYHAACSRICLRYEGFITEFRGDGICAYFGYPRSHEDDAERAVRAGLEIIASMERIDIAIAGPLAVRIGIATGLVVVGTSGNEGSLSEHAVVGDAPNLAARLQDLVPAGSIAIASSTRRLLGDLFHLRDMGPLKVKGFAEPVLAWAVDGVATSMSRFGSYRAADLTDFIGREDEIEFLLKRQQLAWSGAGQAVLIAGEPGIGKSRLALAFAQRLEGQLYTSLIFQCSPHRSSSALHPVIAHLEHAACVKGDDTPSSRIDKLEQLLSATTSSADARVPLFASLLSIPLSDRYPPLALSSRELRQQTLAAVLDYLEAQSRQKPILILFEDAHWADATSLELLEQLVVHIQQLPVLALITIRPEVEPPCVALPNVSHLAIGGLQQQEVESLATRITGGRELPAEVMNAIITKTDGNALFVEELTKAVLESGFLVEDSVGRYRLEAPLPPLAIPATLHDSLMARLDRLEPMKEVAQIGAAIGREFSMSLLRAVFAGNESALLASLAQLEQSGLVFRRGEPAEATYIFKHALVRDAAYESLLKSRRQRLHGEIARALENSFPMITANEPEVVAHHMIEANLVDPAIDYLLKAGKLALGRSANAEAVAHLRRGIGFSQQKGPAPERSRRELDYYLALGPALAAIEGYAAPSTLEAFSRARELLSGDGTLMEQMTVLWGTYLAHNMRAEHRESLHVAQQCLLLAEQHRHPGILALAHRFIGQTLNLMGALVEARMHFERTIALCSADESSMASYRRFGIDDRVGAMFNLARTLLLLGYPDRAVAEAERAVDRARSLARPFTTALALGHAALLGLLTCDQRRVEVHADAAISYSAQHSLPEPEQKARFLKGALLAQTGNPKVGLDIMHTAMAHESKALQGDYRSLYFGIMADARLRVGDPRIALDLLDSTIADTEVTGEKFFLAELFRLRAQVLRALGEQEEAQTYLERALAVARDQEARWWELRAATSLAALCRGTGRASRARFILRAIYGRFNEGFKTPALRAAKQQLAD